MKKLILLSVISVLNFYTAAQTKYLIYFKDKGTTPSTALQKTSSLYKITQQSLNPRAIERRKQVMGDNYITYEDLPVNQSYIDQLKSNNVIIENQLKWFNAISTYLTENQVNLLNKLPFIEKIEPVRIFHYRNDESSILGAAQSIPEGVLKKTTSLDYGGSFTENNLSDIPPVHDLGIKGTGVYIGILDNGTSWRNYNALKNLKVIREYDYVHKVSTVSDQGGHGSMTFCLMAGYDPGFAIGPAYDAQFFLAETENDASETHVEEDNYAAALQDMEGAGVQITSSSLGYWSFDTGQKPYTYADMNGNTTIVTKALNLAFNFGILTFSSAGNERSTNWRFITPPADAFNVIAVGAVDQNNKVTNFSSPGPTYDGRIKPEILAMGMNNYITMGGSNYSYVTVGGTSAAAPIAAGVGALLKSCWPHLTNVQMRKIILDCSDNGANPNNDRGWGLISAKRVITYPNLSAVGSGYQLNKIFIEPTGVNPSTIRLNYKIGSSLSFQTVAMNYDGTLKYNYILPNSNKGDTVQFYFTYLNSSGNSVREPRFLYFDFTYGNLLITSMDNNNSQTIPTQFSLLQNYPNPFNPGTIISYELPVAKHVTLKVYDLLGREVVTLVDEFQNAGKYNSQFSIIHSQFTSGVYFYRLQAGDFSATKKMLLIK